jgi:hypothetical protein
MVNSPLICEFFYQDPYRRPYDPHRPDASTKLAAPAFYCLGFAACFAATIARPFRFVAAALVRFCAACPWFGRREP